MESRRPSTTTSRGPLLGFELVVRQRRDHTCLCGATNVTQIPRTMTSIMMASGVWGKPHECCGVETRPEEYQVKSNALVKFKAKGY